MSMYDLYDNQAKKRQDEKLEKHWQEKRIKMLLNWKGLEDTPENRSRMLKATLEVPITTTKR